jgi:PAS domain S-box-containing protein
MMDESSKILARHKKTTGQILGHMPYGMLAFCDDKIIASNLDVHQISGLNFNDLESEGVTETLTLVGFSDADRQRILSCVSIHGKEMQCAPEGRFPAVIEVTLQPLDINQPDDGYLLILDEHRSKKRMEKSLQAYSTEIRNHKYALDQAAIVAVTDLSGNLTYVNDKFSEITGYPKNELIGSNHRILSSSHHSDAFFQQLWETISQGKNWIGEVKNRHQDGNFYWENKTIVPLLNAKQQPYQYMSISFEITERKAAEEELRLHQVHLQDLVEQRTGELTKTKKNLENILASMAEALFVMTPAGLIESVNPAACALSGYAEDSLIGQSIGKILTDEQELINNNWDIFTSSKTSHTLERIMLPQSGPKIYVLLSGAVVRDDAGEIRSVVCAAQDITDRKKAERALTDQKFALDQSAIVAIMDNYRLITYVNDQFCNLTGYLHDELVDQDNHQIVNSDYHSGDFVYDVFDTVESGKVWRGELANVAKDGEVYWTTTTIVPFTTRDGQVYQYLTIQFDITDRKQMEETQTQMAFQAGMAEMSISVLHNIGNTVNSISNRSQTLREEVANYTMVADALEETKSAAIPELEGLEGYSNAENAQHFMMVMDECVRVLRTLTKEQMENNIGDILTGVQHVAEIIQTQQNLAAHGTSSNLFVSEFSMRELIENIMRLQGDTIKKYEISSELDIEVSVDHVSLPKNQIMQMFMNLIKNSLEAIQERLDNDEEFSQGRIQVYGKRSGENMITLTIEDNGCGILNDKLDSIFNFGASSKSRGSGFGLHSVANFVQSIAGEISVESQGINQGAMFVIQLPTRWVSPDFSDNV